MQEFRPGSTRIFCRWPKHIRRFPRTSEDHLRHFKHFPIPAQRPKLFKVNKKEGVAKKNPPHLILFIDWLNEFLWTWINLLSAHFRIDRHILMQDYRLSYSVFQFFLFQSYWFLNTMFKVNYKTQNKLTEPHQLLFLNNLSPLRALSFKNNMVP